MKQYLFAVILLTTGTAVAQTWQPGFEFPQFTDTEKVSLARSCVCNEAILVKNGFTPERAEEVSTDALVGTFGFTSDNAHTVVNQAKADLALKKWSLTACTEINDRSSRLGNRFSDLMSKKYPSN
jgi:hypothetical protein